MLTVMKPATSPAPNISRTSLQLRGEDRDPLLRANAVRQQHIGGAIDAVRELPMGVTPALEDKAGAVAVERRVALDEVAEDHRTP